MLGMAWKGLVCGTSEELKFLCFVFGSGVFHLTHSLRGLLQQTVMKHGDATVGKVGIGTFCSMDRSQILL